MTAPPPAEKKGTGHFLCSAPAGPSGQKGACPLFLPIPDHLVVLTFDDGCKSDVDFVAPLLVEYGFGATFFVNEASGWRGGDDRNYMTWQDVREVHQAGFEIGNHTRSHPNVSSLSRQAFLAELEFIERRCQEHGVPVPRSFCYPGYHFGRNAAEVLAEKGYSFARRGSSPEVPYNESGQRGLVYDPAEHHPLLVPATGVSGPDWCADDLAWGVDQARSGRIAVLNFHGVPDVEHPWVHTDPKAFLGYMDFLRDRGCTVIAMRDLVRYVAPAAGPPTRLRPW